MIFQLFSNPSALIGFLIAIILGFTVHEFSHALMAYKLGDDTAKRVGRLSLNPLVHIDRMGFIALLFAGFGWAKPVPYNPNNLQKPKRDSLFISLAGPFSNFVVAFVTMIPLVFFVLQGDTNNLLFVVLQWIVAINLGLMAFNLLPIPPLDGAELLHILTPAKYDHIRQQLVYYGPILLLFFIFSDIFVGVGILDGIIQFFFSLLSYIAVLILGLFGLV